MNKKSRIIASIGIAVLLAAVVTVGAALAQGSMPGRGNNWGSNMMGNSAVDDGIDPGEPGSMMGGYGWGGQGMMYPGMMGGRGWGGWGMMHGGMMGGYGGCDAWDNPVAGTPLTLGQAGELAEEAIASYGDPDLEVGEIMQFSQNFYVLAREESTGRGAFELLINPVTGAISPEPGPNMMWNTKYGHMGGMMGGFGMGGMMGGRWFARPGDTMSVTPEQAVEYAQQWLDANMPGAVADEAPDQFYGYYTLHTLQDDEISGMLSVNGYTGQIWYHNWHGDFIAMTGEHAE